MATPWTTRATISSGTPTAVANTTIDTTWPSSPARSTGRRPTWSEIRPSTSNPASTATAYTPNTTVVVMGEKPHSAWYSG